ncbi:hypothetical protein [Kangiella koreensis]|uniref:Uncharacterized protein n=1 Tax=Kangiella koreensis (strain DSM 16069 / JCM 12317 / KCTC 12182 / SW-125) TaxID=523791 RepID=C7RB12_KANKD|nr:hypothetical protein [Kangiella koreensis]ACV26454.1 hypothetical protein Kkor_1035 [Kangiella koreensis DSM 16069]
MGAGFYMMIALSIVIYTIALADKKQGWIWFGVNLCVSMVLGKFYGLTVALAFIGFVITFLIMFVVNIFKENSN